LTPDQQLAAIDEVAARLVQRQQRCWADLQKRLRAEGIFILDHEALTTGDRAWLRQLFVDRLLPVLTPIAIDPAHPFPFIPNRALAMVLELRRDDGSQINALVLVPERVERLIRLPGESARFILVEDVILAVGLPELFPGMAPLGHGEFRALRDSDIEIEEKAQDLVVMFESALKRRRRGQIIRLKPARRAACAIL
jgi:polyphosphate kinase